MRVLCFGRFYDEIPGGMQRHVEHLFAALRSEVDFVHLVPSRDRNSGRTLLHGFPVIRAASLNVDGSLAISPTLPLVARQLHRERPFDAIHLHFPDPMSHLASVALPSGIPRIISWHADIVRHRLLMLAYRRLLERSVRSAHAIIVATPSHVTSSEVLQRHADESKIHVIPYGFDLRQLVRPHPLADALRKQHPGVMILAVGRHVSYKGFDVLIRAMCTVERSARLVIVGTGPLTETWKSLVTTLGLQDRIAFAGLVADEDLPAYYQACDVFCLPSLTRAEAFGIVQIEAMACAKPVVSTRLGTGVDFVNVDNITGYTVQPGDAERLSDALNRLVRDENLRACFGEAARMRAEVEFSLPTMGERTLALYREAVSASRPQ